VDDALIEICYDLKQYKIKNSFEKFENNKE